MTTDTLHTGTPAITVLGQGGHALRQLRYCRTQVGEPAQERISSCTFNDAGQLTASADARFHAAGDANIQYQSSLNSQVLRTDSVDAGISHTLYDIEGRPIWQQDALGVTQRYHYDALGRLTARCENAADSAATTVRERLIYGDDAAIADNKNKNLCGQVARHYDTAGLMDQSAQGFTVHGKLVQQTRRLLPMDSNSDWRGEDETAWQDVLEIGAYTTDWSYDAHGQVVLQTDAKRHTQDMAYDVQGRLKRSGVTLSADDRQVVLVSQHYSAAGLKSREQTGNGVVSDYAYEPQTQRLVGLRTTRATDGAVLQNLSYDYDPVGNITAIADDSQPISYFRNQRVDANKTYVYDSLYQLISATGRENADASPGQCIDRPEAVVPIDPNNVINYTRRYSYDAGGNLRQIQHQGAQNYLRTLKVSANSNHAVQDTLTGEVESYFDAAGNQRTLTTGQNLTWNTLNQLQQVTIVAREHGEDDRETYQYGAGGLRVRKTLSQQASGGVQRQDVIYLPGLELRRTYNDATCAEDLDMLTIGAAGRSQVRLLSWTAGKPQNIPNQQMRYSLDDHLGSSQLELDAAGGVLTREEYYPYGGTAVWSAKSQAEAKYKVVRYSGKARDASGLYYYGLRYYQPWLARWLNADPAGTVDGLNLYRMVGNNPVNFTDQHGASRSRSRHLFRLATFAARSRGEGAASSAKRGAKITRGILTGLAVAGAVFSLAGTLGAAIGVALGVAAAGFVVGAAIGFFYKKITEKIAGFLARKIQDRSFQTQALITGAYAAASAAVGGASERGVSIAGAVGSMSGVAGAVINDADRGMGGANAAAVAVSTVDVMEANRATTIMEVSSAMGGTIGGLITGTAGSSEVGENAAYGAWAGGKIGRCIDSVYRCGVKIFLRLVVEPGIDYYFSGSGALGAAIKYGSKRIIRKVVNKALDYIGPREWAGSIYGGVAGGVGTAIYQLNKDNYLGRAMAATASAVSTGAGYVMDLISNTVMTSAAFSLAWDFTRSSANWVMSQYS